VSTRANLLLTITAALTPRYLQHNPNVTSGRDNVVAYFSGGKRAEMTPPMRTAQENGTFAGLTVTTSVQGGEPADTFASCLTGPDTSVFPRKGPTRAS